MQCSFYPSERQYETVDEVLEAVKSSEVDISLMDAFTATSLQSKIAKNSLKVKDVINANTGYGVVLSNEFVRLESDFRSYITSNKALISSFTANMTNQLQVHITLIKVVIIASTTGKLEGSMIHALRCVNL